MDIGIASILKVNHAGEFAAIEIYKTQIFFSKLFYPELTQFLTETLQHERIHCKTFREMMKTREAKPCRAAFFWARGGCILGIITGMMGKNAVLACTAAVEGTVHHHMNEQIEYLASRDLELKNYVENVRDEEFGHLKFAVDNLLTKNFFTKIIEKVVINSTEAIIWLSTWGAVQRMRKEICN